MTPEGLRPSPALQVSSYTDFDRFREEVRIVLADSIPLDLKRFSTSRAIVRLPGCELHLQRTFPRILDVMWRQSGVLVIIPMEDMPSTTMNGFTVDRPAIAVARGAAIHRTVERAGRLCALMAFASPLRERGWPDVEDAFGIFRLTSASLGALQRTVQRVLREAESSSASLAQGLAGHALKESLLAALDAALFEAAPMGLERSAGYRQHRRLIEDIDAIVQANPSEPVYSGQLAAALGVSVRTLHTATVRFRGVSLHQYLRARRLSAVRAQLCKPPPTLRVKACALAHGFGHLGEFAAAYQAMFGEPPSATLERARHRAG
jgi:AraC family ethanolamine operon transcriptional activator